MSGISRYLPNTAARMKEKNVPPRAANAACFIGGSRRVSALSISEPNAWLKDAPSANSSPIGSTLHSFEGRFHRRPSYHPACQFIRPYS